MVYIQYLKVMLLLRYRSSIEVGRYTKATDGMAERLQDKLPSGRQSQ